MDYQQFSGKLKYSEVSHLKKGSDLSRLMSYARRA